MVGGLCVRKRCPSRAARLWGLLGGSDQLRDKNRVGRPTPARTVRPLGRRDYGHQRDTSRLWLKDDAVIYRRLWSIGG